MRTPRSVLLFDPARGDPRHPGLCLSGEQAVSSAITMSLSTPPRVSGFLRASPRWVPPGTLLTLLVFIPIAAMPSEQLLTWGHGCRSGPPLSWVVAAYLNPPPRPGAA